MDNRRPKEKRPHRLKSTDLPDLRSLTPTQDDSAPFQPEPEELPPIEELLNLAEVDEEDAKRIAVQWYEDAPDDDYNGILNATEIEESG